MHQLFINTYYHECNSNSFGIISDIHFVNFKRKYKISGGIFFFIIILSFSVAAFHSFILIDYDWRYRFPIILPLITLIPISLEMILRKLIYKDKLLLKFYL